MHLVENQKTVDDRQDNCMSIHRTDQSMRYGRAKSARKTLQFFRLSHGITSPFHVLIDGTFIMAVITQKVPLNDRLEKLLQHKQFSLHVPRSALNELRNMSEQPSAKKESFKEAWKWGLDECDQVLEVDDIGQVEVSNDLGVPGKDIVRLVSPKPHYFVATQDEELLDLLREMGNVPIMRLARGVLLLENPSKAALKNAKCTEKSKWTVAGSLQEQEQELVRHVRERQQRENQPKQTPVYSRRKKAKAKGPNPLSCKRKRSSEDETTTKKRRRRKNAK